MLSLKRVFTWPWLNAEKSVRLSKNAGSFRLSELVGKVQKSMKVGGCGDSPRGTGRSVFENTECVVITHLNYYAFSLLLTNAFVCYILCMYYWCTTNKVNVINQPFIILSFIIILSNCCFIIIIIIIYHQVQWKEFLCI